MDLASLKRVTKPTGKAMVSSCGTRVGADGTLVPSPGPSQRKKCAGILRWVYSVGLLQPKRGILAICLRKQSW